MNYYCGLIHFKFARCSKLIEFESTYMLDLTVIFLCPNSSESCGILFTETLFLSIIDY